MRRPRQSLVWAHRIGRRQSLVRTLATTRQAVVDHGRQRDAVARIDGTPTIGRQVAWALDADPVVRIDRPIDAGQTLIRMSLLDAIVRIDRATATVDALQEASNKRHYLTSFISH
jgi:hypothetical protein